MTKSPKQLAGIRYRLQHIDGVKDVEIGNASVEARARGNFHVTGKGTDSDDSGFSDVEARRKRQPFLFFEIDA